MDSQEAFEMWKIWTSSLEADLILPSEHEARKRAFLASIRRQRGNENAANNKAVFHDFAEVLAQRHLASSEPWRVEMSSHRAAYESILDAAKEVEISDLQNEVRKRAQAHELAP